MSARCQRTIRDRRLCYLDATIRLVQSQACFREINPPETAPEQTPDFGFHAEIERVAAGVNADRWYLTDLFHCGAIVCFRVVGKHPFYHSRSPLMTHSGQP